MLIGSSLLSIFIVKMSSPRHFKWSYIVEEKVGTLQYISRGSLTLAKGSPRKCFFFSKTASLIIQWVARGGAILNIFFNFIPTIFLLGTSGNAVLYTRRRSYLTIREAVKNYLADFFR